MEREPEARYLSAGDLAEDLERWLAGRAIVARRVPAAVRAWRWSKRNPRFAGALATSVALLVLNLIAAFTISHLLSMVNCIRLIHHTVATVQFQDLHEVTAASNPVAESRNVFATAEAKTDALERSIEDPGSEASFAETPPRSDS